MHPHSDRVVDPIPSLPRFARDALRITAPHCPSKFTTLRVRLVLGRQGILHDRASERVDYSSSASGAHATAWRVYPARGARQSHIPGCAVLRRQIVPGKWIELNPWGLSAEYPLSPNAPTGAAEILCVDDGGRVYQFFAVIVRFNQGDCSSSVAIWHLVQPGDVPTCHQGRVAARTDLAQKCSPSVAILTLSRTYCEASTALHFGASRGYSVGPGGFAMGLLAMASSSALVEVLDAESGLAVHRDHAPTSRSSCRAARQLSRRERTRGRLQLNATLGLSPTDRDGGA